MFELPLQIFPGGGFDSSIITVVFVGLLVMWALTETMGFVFIGLVVPGYLASVIAIAPTPAAVVVVESIVTYGIVWLLSDGFSRLGVWSMSFGRDRFFAFLLVSLLVRLVGELWLWPVAWHGWTTWSGVSPQLPGALTSVGLVLVPLAANMFWKLGLARGIWQIGFPTAVVYALTVNVLLPLSNLRFSEFQVHYEDVAIDIIASPKAYIIMIVAAALAARANIRFGWDSGGILIPALLAIAWFDVSKVAVTLIEAVLLVYVAKALMKTRFVRRWNMEGPRRIVFVFTVGYILKFVLAWLLYFWVPDVRVTDFFGFGYLLSSLLALKMLQRKQIAVVMIPTVLISIAGFVLGGVIAAGLGSVTRPPPPEVGAPAALTDKSAWERATVGAVMTGREVFGGDPIRADELAEFERLIYRIVAFRKTNAWPDEETKRAVDEAGLEMTVGDSGDRRWLVVAEPVENYPRTRGWGVVVLSDRGSGPLLLVPESGGDPIRVLAALELARRVDASGVVFGAHAETPAGRSLEPRRSSSSPYHIAARQLRRFDMVEVLFSSAGGLWIETAVGPDFPLAPLTALVSNEELRWSAYPNPPIQRSIVGRAYATVALDERALLRLAGSVDDTGTLQRESAALADALERRLTGENRIVANSLIGLGEPITAGEHEAARRGVLLPLLDLADSPPPAAQERRIIKSVLHVARSLGLRVAQTQYQDQCWWLVHDDERSLRGWGLAAIRCDGGAPLAVLSPFPLREASSWRFAATLARDLDARILGVGATMRVDGAAPRGDALRHPALLSAVHRAATINTLPALTPALWTVEVRGVGAGSLSDADALLARESPMNVGEPELFVRLLSERLRDSGLEVKLDRGELETASLRGQPDEPLSYAREMSGGRFVRLWLSAAFRTRLSPRPTPDTIDWLARTRGIDVVDRLAQLEDVRVEADSVLSERDALVDEAQRFAATQNPLALELLVSQMKQLGAAPAVWREPDGERMWLVTRTRDLRVVGVRLQEAAPDLHVNDFGPLRGISAASFAMEAP